MKEKEDIRFREEKVKWLVLQEQRRNARLVRKQCTWWMSSLLITKCITRLVLDAIIAKELSRFDFYHSPFVLFLDLIILGIDLGCKNSVEHVLCWILMRVLLDKVVIGFFFCSILDGITELGVNDGISFFFARFLMVDFCISLFRCLW